MCYELGQTESSHRYFISLPLTLSLCFSIILEYCVCWGFLFHQSNFRRRKGEDLVGLVVKPVYNIVKKIAFRIKYGMVPMEPPRCQKYFPVSQRLLRNLCTLTTCLLHPPRSSEMQRRVQAVPGLFSGRWYTMVLCITDVFKFSLSRTTTGIPHRRGRLNRRDSEAKQLQRFCRKQFNYHKNVLTEPVTPEVCSFHLSGLPAS